MARIITEETTLKNVVGSLEKESSVLGGIWKYELYFGVDASLFGLAIGFFYNSWGIAIVGGVAFFLGISHYFKRSDNTANIGRFQYGAAGEATVTEMLKSGLPDTYMIMNDVTIKAGTSKAQNDHIVLGPNGIFVIETKAYSGTLSGKADDDYLDQVKEYKGKKTENKIKNPVPQNEYHLDVVKRKMQEGEFAVDDLHSIIVFTNRYARIRIEGSKVPLLKPEMICVTIKNTVSKFTYDEEWLKRLASFLLA